MLSNPNNYQEQVKIRDYINENELNYHTAIIAWNKYINKNIWIYNFSKNLKKTYCIDSKLFFEGYWNNDEDNEDSFFRNPNQTK